MQDGPQGRFNMSQLKADSGLLMNQPQGGSVILMNQPETVNPKSTKLMLTGQYKDPILKRPDGLNQTNRSSRGTCLELREKLCSFGIQQPRLTL